MADRSNGSYMPDNQIALSEEELNRKKIEKGSKGFLGFFVKRIRVTLLIILGLTVWGVISAISLPREANPEVKIPFAVVMTLFPGASPQDVEELVTDKIEEKVKNLDDVKLITSTSALSLSSVFVEFEAEADLEKSIADLEDVVDSVRNLPEDAEDPIVSQINFNDVPIVTFSLSGPLTPEEFKALGEMIQDELEAISGVSEVPLVGARTREITVEVNSGELERLRISAVQVATSIQLANVSLPLGDVELGDVLYNVRSSGKLKSVEDLKVVAVANQGSNPVLLGDIANIKDELAEETSISRVSVAGQKTQLAISLQVYKRTGGNIISIVDTAKEKLELLQSAGVIPENVDIEVTSDFSQFIRDDFNTLTNSGLQTIVIILALLSFTLSFRKAIIAIISIPLVFLMALGIISLTGSTLNSLVLFSLVLSLGLLVDTIIVLLEGIHDGLRKGFSPTDAAFYSLETYKWPIISGVLTTVAAFVPMYLVSGILGEFLKTLPTTIASTLGASLFVGLFIMPGISALILRNTKKFQHEKKSFVEKHIIDKLARFYSRNLRSVMISKSKKWKFVGVLILALVVSLGSVAVGIIPVTLFPEIDIDTFFVQIELPAGSTLEQTNAITARVEGVLLEIPEIKNFVTNIGVTLNTGDGELRGGESRNTAQIVVNLLPEKERRRTSIEIAAGVRELIADIGSAEIEVQELSGGPPTGAPVEIRVVGNDLADLSIAASQVEKILSEIEGVIDIQSDSKTTPPEFSFKLKHDNLGRYGLNAASVSGSLRAAIAGVTATSLSIDGEDIDVVIEVLGGKVKSIEEIKNLSLVSPSGQIVKLDQVADFSITPALESIRHRDLKRIVNVRADVEGTSPRAVQSRFEEAVERADLPQGIEALFGGEVEDIQQSFTELWYSMIVAVILILFIMVFQFDSFKQPIIILLTLPLAVIGVTFGTFVIGLDFGFSTFLGIVALSGIVVNDAIILIDRINYNIKTRRMKTSEAVIEAGEARFQPIMITTLTTIAGVIPLAFADEFWRGLSVAVAFGIAFATILTLVLVPILYLKLEGKRIGSSL